MKKSATDRYYSISDLRLQAICDQFLHVALLDFRPLLNAGIRAETLLALSNLRDSFAEYPSEAEIAPALNKLLSDFELAETSLKTQLQQLCKTVSKELGHGSVHHARLEAKRFNNHEELLRSAKRALIQAEMLLKDELLSPFIQEPVKELKQLVEKTDTLLTLLRTAQLEHRLAIMDKVELGNSLYVQLIALTLTCTSSIPNEVYSTLYQELQPSHTLAEKNFELRVA